MINEYSLDPEIEVLPAETVKVYNPRKFNMRERWHWKLCASDAEVYTMITLVELLPADTPNKRG